MPIKIKNYFKRQPSKLIIKNKELITYQPTTKIFKFNDRDNQHSIENAIDILISGVLGLAVVEHYGIKPTNILGITPGLLPTLYFDKQGFSKISKQTVDLELIKNSETCSAMFLIPEFSLKQLHSLNIFKKFPFFKDIINIQNYKDKNKIVEYQSLIVRCKQMQSMWKEWSGTGLPHIISSLQALQRHLASKMNHPLSADFEYPIKNGLSIEYQAEFYAEHLYGAKLLDAWHDYLISSEPNSRQPTQFLNWLKTQSIEKLEELGIPHLEEIPKVQYITDIQERGKWQLTFSLENSVTNDNLPKPKHLNEKIEIIYALGNSETQDKQFYGGIKKRGTFNHSSFFAGEKVDGAGRMLLTAKEDNNKLHWVIHELDNNSGHIKPPDEMSLSILKHLKALGVNLKTISWKSKWGTVGACDETAEIALKRLDNDLESIKISEIIPTEKLTSVFLKKLNEASSDGLLGTIDDLITTQSYTLTIAQSPIAAVLIKKALGIHLRITGIDTAHPDLAKSLVNHAVQFLRNAGKRSLRLENDLEHIIKRYESNYRLFKHTLTSDRISLTKEDSPTFLSRQKYPILRRHTKCIFFRAHTNPISEFTPEITPHLQLKL